MDTKTRALTDALTGAATATDLDTVNQEVDRLRVELGKVTADEAVTYARNALQTLSKRRLFAQMGTIAEAALRTGIEDPVIQRRYAQALIGQGMADPALEKLRRLEHVSQPGTETREVKRLMAKAYKQMFLESAAPGSAAAHAFLVRAVAAYRDAYRRGEAKAPSNAIDAAALIHRATREGMALPADTPSVDALAAEVLDGIGATPTRDLTAAEAAAATQATVALGMYEKAAGWLDALVSRAETEGDASRLGRTLRQLREVWQLDEREQPQRALTQLLEASVLKTPGGAVVFQATEPTARARQLGEDAAYLERVFGADRYTTMAWYKRGLECAQSVARIKRKLGRTIGTGFVLPGALLRNDWAGRSFVVTNFHVVNRAGVNPGRPPHDIEVCFDERDLTLAVAEVRWESPLGPLGQYPPETVDTVVLLTERAPDWAPAYGLAESLPAKGERLYVIGHPHGQELAFSLQDNHVVERSPEVLHYRSPTDPGSSGSPLFDDHWQLVGIHHAGKTDMPSLVEPGETYQANEGFTVDAIRRRV